MTAKSVSPFHLQEEQLAQAISGLLSGLVGALVRRLAFEVVTFTRTAGRVEDAPSGRRLTAG